MIVYSVMVHVRTPNTIFIQLREQGYRLTQARRCLITILMQTQKPVSVQDLEQVMRQQHVSINLTTIYRELEFLKQQGMIHELQLGEGMKRFEFSLGVHHHHIRCLQCDRIADVTISHTLQSEMIKIKRQTGFTVVDHALEFVGLCPNCR